MAHKVPLAPLDRTDVTELFSMKRAITLLLKVMLLAAVGNLMLT